MIGKTLGHYQITEKLGEGGMGVVYKARDLHLDRFVALKILPPEKVADLERKRRFVQEAKAASALNHPNIIHVYDIDQSDGTDFIAMEYVDGKTLDQLIPRKGMRLNEVLKYAVQIADALATAHAAGIVHRDLKPANVMVTEKGLVKVLDFGLAKLTETSGPEAETAETRTGAGTVLGTAAYMSPEQAEGKHIDTRSDIFSFGSMLYEMLTGQRAFRGDTRASTIASILKEEPRPISQVAEGMPHDAEKIVRRCLRKDPEYRFQTMADLRVVLVELKEESDSGALETAEAPRVAVRSKLRWAFALAGIVIVAVVLGIASWFWWSRAHPTPAESSPTAVPLTSYPGAELFPSFSLDGTQVTFQWCPEGWAPGKNCDICIKQIGMEPPSRLTDTPAIEVSPAWSPDGRFIAFLRGMPPTATSCSLILMPQRGGYERVLAEWDVSKAQNPLPTDAPYLAWTPDSRWVATPVPEAESGIWSLYLFSVETGERRRLTSPSDAVEDTAPAFSPDGRTLGFARISLLGSKSNLCLLRLAEGYRPQGEPERIRLDAPYVIGSAWTSDGAEILFGASLGLWRNLGLWRIAVSKSARPQRLSFAPNDAFAPAVSRRGNRLAYAVAMYDYNIWQLDLPKAGLKPGLPVRLISSTRRDVTASYSPDGKRIAFASDRSGTMEIWASERDGSNPVQLTSMGGPLVVAPRWSPDGQHIAFWGLVGDESFFYVIGRNGGAPRRLGSQASYGRWPCWSRDGHSIYFTAEASDGPQIWVMPVGGEKATQITRDPGADLPHESPDGKFVYYSKGWPFAQSVWKVPAEGGKPTKILDEVHPEAFWAVGRDGIYFFTKPDDQGHSDLSVHEFDTGKTRKIVTIERPVIESIDVSPDGRTILYTQVDEAGSDLMLVENFR